MRQSTTIVTTYQTKEPENQDLKHMGRSSPESGAGALDWSWVESDPLSILSHVYSS